GSVAHSRHGALERVRQRLAGQLLEFRLGIEEIEMARPAVQEAPDNALGMCLEVRRSRRQWIGKRLFLRARSRRVLGEERQERQRAKAASCTKEKITARGNGFVMQHHASVTSYSLGRKGFRGLPFDFATKA